MQPFYKITLTDDNGKPFFGPGPYRLFRELERLGSLSAAARELQMSYSKAIRIVSDAEKGLGYKLTTRRIGGEGGGSSELTREARIFLARYDLWVKQVKQAGNGFFERSMLAPAVTFGCVVLANGRSTRFGSQKLLADCAGRPVIARTLSTLKAAGLTPVVATSDPDVAEAVRQEGVEIVPVDGPDQSDSMKAGLAAIGDVDGCMFVVGDQPGLTRATVEELMSVFASDPTCVVRLADGEVPGNPVVFPAECFGRLEAVTGDVGGASVVDEARDAGRLRLVQVSDPTELIDVDTPEALDQVVQGIEKR